MAASRSNGVTMRRNHSWVTTSATPSSAIATTSPASATSGTSQIRYWGEKTLPNATKPATATLAPRSSVRGSGRRRATMPATAITTAA
jgi:hypothetical protein